MTRVGLFKGVVITSFDLPSDRDRLSKHSSVQSLSPLAEADPATRKVLGIFYTDGAIAELLAQLTVRDARARTLDLSCGDGRLLVAAYNTKKGLLPPSRRETKRSALLTDLFGVDIVPDAARQAASRLLLEAVPPRYTPLNLAVSDATSLKPGKILPTLTLNLRKRRAVEHANMTTVDALLMNPPFTRQEKLGRHFKLKLTKRFNEYAEYSSGRIGLYGYFVFLADMFVKRGGRLGMILPASVLRLKSTAGLRRLLIRNYSVEYVVMRTNGPGFSDASSFREAMFVATKCAKTREDLRSIPERSCVFVQLLRDPLTSDEAYQMARRIRRFSTSQSTSYCDRDFIARKVPQSVLNNDLENPFCLLSGIDGSNYELWPRIVSNANSKLISLVEYLGAYGGEIWRGLETRRDIGLPVQETFIARSQCRVRGLRDRWVAVSQRHRFLVCTDRASGKKIKIHRKHLRLGLRRLAGCNRFDIGGETDWVLRGSGLKRIRTKMVQTDRWDSHVGARSGTVAIARRFGITRSGTCHLALCCNSAFSPSGIMWSIKNLRPKEAKILTLWFNSSPNILQVLRQRVETCGPWMELPEYIMNNLLVLRPGALTKVQADRLSTLYRTYGRIRFPSLGEQLKRRFHARSAIDRTIFECLGFDSKSAMKAARMSQLALRAEFKKLAALRTQKGGDL